MFQNIFLALAKYNSASDENYLTEAFVFVLNSLLEKDRPVCFEILRRLCVKDDEYSFAPDENISISTQESTEQGRPDIKISSTNKLIYIEVKHDSDLGYRQIERYKAALKLPNTASKKHKYVILLTRFAVDFDEQQEQPYKHIRWFEIYNWFSNAKAKDHVNVYLIKSFMAFLEVKKMSIQKVTWEYINGVPAFKNLMNMVEVAIESASLSKKKSPGWEWMGFYIQNKEFFCGILYEKHLSLIFQVLEDDRVVFTYSLDLESIHFFSLDKDKQLEEITTFLKRSYEDAQQIETKEK